MNFDSSDYCWTDWFTWVHPSSGHLPCGKRGRQRIWRLVPTILFSCTGLDVGNAQVSHKSQRQIFLNFLKILESEISSQTQFGELSLLTWWSIIADLSDAAETESGIGIIKNSKRWSFVCFLLKRDSIDYIQSLDSNRTAPNEKQFRLGRVSWRRSSTSDLSIALVFGGECFQTLKFRGSLALRPWFSTRWPKRSHLANVQLSATAAIERWSTRHRQQANARCRNPLDFVAPARDSLR